MESVTVINKTTQNYRKQKKQSTENNTYTIHIKIYLFKGCVGVYQEKLSHKEIEAQLHDTMAIKKLTALHSQNCLNIVCEPRD